MGKRSISAALVAFCVALPVASFRMRSWGSVLSAVAAAVFLLGIIACLALLVTRLRPMRKSIAAVVTVVLTECAVVPLAGWLGAKVFVAQVKDRLPDYVRIVDSLHFLERQGRRRLAIQNPHPDIAWADIPGGLGSRGVVRLAFRHSPRTVRLWWCRDGSVLPPRDEIGRCRVRLAGDWYWYQSC